MKKGCLIVLAVVAVLLLAVAISGMVALRIANEKVGWRLASEISHEDFATTETRIRLVVRPELLTPYLIDFIPEDVGVPTAGFELVEVLHHIIPREVAVLVRSDVIARQMRLTLFINEKRGGPLIERLVNDANPFAQVTQIAWTSNGIELRERGTLVAEGYLPIPGDVETELLEIWPTRAQQPAAAIEGRNHAELVIDNHNGDILALAAAIAVAAGETWNDVRQEQMADMVVTIIESIHVARLAANMLDRDSAAFDVQITADPQSGPNLHALLTGLGMPLLTDILKREHDLTLTGDMHWDEQRSAIVGSYTLTGLEPFLKEHLDL